MDKPTISSLFSDAAKYMRAEFEFIRGSNPHPGEKGAEVQEVLRKFLNKHLPQRFRAAGGYVIDTENNLSRQTDLIVYDALASAVYRASETTQIVPVDTVASVIEVKTSLSKAELADAIMKIASVKTLKKRAMSNMDRSTTASGLDVTAIGRVRCR